VGSFEIRAEVNRRFSPRIMTNDEKAGEQVMGSVTEKLASREILLKRAEPGRSYKLLCPRCSHSRRNRRDPCLSVTVHHDGENAMWNCHHCNWSGSTKWDDREEPPRKRRPPPVRPKGDAIERPTVEVMRWFLDRSIPAEVVSRNRIGFVRQHFIAKLGRDVPCIAFPYYRQGELVNVKYRALEEKAFAQVKDAEAILFGLDDIAGIGDGNVIIVEGECDKLALEVAGFHNVVSVPDGAPATLRDEPRNDDSKFAWLANCAKELEAVTGGFILAVDNDANGEVLEEELARRLGKERCWRVHWPDSDDVICKDANEALTVHGPEVLRECIAAATPYPINGLYRIDDYEAEILALYREGTQQRGASTGWTALDELMTIAPGQLSVVTGIPSHGKSEFLDALLINLARRYDWHVALCSFENRPTDHSVKLFEKYLGVPFRDGSIRRMGEGDLRMALDWARPRFFFIRAEDDAPPTVDWILERARAAVLRYGSNVLVIDPYNEIEHRRPDNMSETEFVSQSLGKVKRFAENHALHVFFVAHPAKPAREAGKPAVPGLYDISGSAHWANKADLGFVVHRPNFEGDEVQIHVLKVRHKWVGEPGQVSLRYDRITGRYSEPVQSPADGARGYRDD
jgi:twinkle protein